MMQKYYLIGWPDSQEFMDNDNCYLVDCGESSVYAVPCELIDNPCDINGDCIEIGDTVIWYDPEEKTRDLSRKWTVSKIDGDIILITVDEPYHSEAEVFPNELEIV